MVFMTLGASAPSCELSARVDAAAGGAAGAADGSGALGAAGAAGATAPPMAFPCSPTNGGCMYSGAEGPAGGMREIGMGPGAI